MSTRVLALGLSAAAALAHAEGNETMEILPIEEGLTLAQFGPPSAPHTVLVRSDDGETIGGLNVSAWLGEYAEHPLDIAARLEGRLPDALAAAPNVSVPYTDLLPLGRWAEAHVAAGVNYAAHAEESSVEGGGFLFPKRTAATPARAELGVLDTDMMDYEVELAVTFDRDIANTADFEGARAGFFVCNDFTERATLARNADRNNVQSGKGFPDAKGFPGSFQTGPYLVVPKDWRAFLGQVTIALSVNGQPRQAAPVTEMQTPIPGLLDEALAHGAAEKWTHRGAPVALLPAGQFTKGMALLTGTPAGVVFAPPGRAFIAANAAYGALTLRMFRGGLSTYVVEQFIAEAIASRRFLQPGDTVAARGRFLGAATARVVRATTR